MGFQNYKNSDVIVVWSTPNTIITMATTHVIVVATEAADDAMVDYVTVWLGLRPGESAVEGD